MNNDNSTKIILKTFYRGLPVIIAVMCIFVLAAKRYLRYTTPMFESTAKIKLADIREGASNANLYKDFDVFVHNNKIGAEVELIKSEALIEKAIRDLDLEVSIFRIGKIHKTELYKESPIEIAIDSISPKLKDKPFQLKISGNKQVEITSPDGEKAISKVGVPIHGKGYKVSVTLNDSLLSARPNMPVNDNYEFVVNSQAHIVSGIAANLDIMSVDKDIPILRVSYKSPVAVKSADIVNNIAVAYINDYIEEKCLSADTTESFLTEQLKIYNTKLAASENQIESYRDAKTIINIRQETETDLRKVADLKKQLASVQMNLKAIDSLNQYIAGNKNRFLELAPNFEAFTDLLSTEIVKNIKQLQGEKKELLTRYTPQNEKVRVVDDKIQDLSHYLQESIRNTETNLKIKYNDLSQTISDAEDEFIGLPEKERTMTILERNFALNEQIYRFLHEKRTEAQIAKAANISFHRIINRGEIPHTPVSPNKKLIIVFSGFLGFIFSLIGIFGVHHLKARVDNENNIYRNSDTPLLASVPFIKKPSQKNKVFEKIALEFELQGRVQEGSIITINSLNEKEGKHFFATGLAHAFMKLGKKVLMVMLDEDKISGVAGINTISVIELPEKWVRPVEWEHMIEGWQEQYDLIIVSNAPVNRETSAIVPLATAILNLFVVDSRITKIRELGQIDELCEKLNLRSQGFVLNRAGYAPTILSQFKNLFKKPSNAL